MSLGRSRGTEVMKGWNMAGQRKHSARHALYYRENAGFGGTSL